MKDQATEKNFKPNYSRTSIYKHYIEKINASEFATISKLSIREKDNLSFSGLILFDKDRKSFIGVGRGKNQVGKIVDGAITEDGSTLISLRKDGNELGIYFGSLENAEVSFSTIESETINENAASVALTGICGGDFVFSSYIRLNYGSMQRRIETKERLSNLALSIKMKKHDDNK